MTDVSIIKGRFFAGGWEVRQRAVKEDAPYNEHTVGWTVTVRRGTRAVMRTAPYLSEAWEKIATEVPHPEEP